MSADFVKVYSSFWTGSLRDQPPYARLLFLSLLDLCDSTGEVRATTAYIAAHAALSESDVKDGLERLSSPDAESNCPDEEGRRILRTGTQTWRIVNYVKYYEMHRAQERKEYLREAKRRQRARDVNTCQQESTCQPQKEKEKEKEKRKEREGPPAAFRPPTVEEASLFLLEIGGTRQEAEDFWEHFENCGWRLSGGRGAKMKDWKLAANRWHRHQADFKGNGKPQAEDHSESFLDRERKRTQEMLREARGE